MELECQECGKIYQSAQVGAAEKASIWICPSCGSINEVPTTSKPEELTKMREATQKESISDFERFILHSYHRKAHTGITIGLICQLLGLITAISAVFMPAFIGLAVLLFGLGAIFFLWGSANYMSSKGYSSAWGILGLLSFIGWAIMALFPDKYREYKRFARLKWE